MKFLADENFPLDAVEALREAGHDVTWIRTDSPGVDDQTVLKRAVSESRLLLTFDKDFDELAFRANLPATSGIILFRFTIRSPQFVVKRVTAGIASRNDWAGHFAMIDDYQIRMRKLPEGTEREAE
ncbi:MAG: hypothetical protein BroJett039_00750 [Chloroflexota bacterium]|nr:MAG: hypothetical protein BroJett039_00750 [Chloroflexota bacterium]